MKKHLISGFILTLLAPVWAVDDHILISEAISQPDSDEMIEIVNLTGATVDLSNYYLADTAYATISAATPTPNTLDFIAQFPFGTTIADGQVMVIALRGTDFINSTGLTPDFEIVSQNAGVPDMILTAGCGTGTCGITNAGEYAALFFWDGSSDLVSDVDVVNIGPGSGSNVWPEKDGITVGASTYANDSTLLLTPTVGASSSLTRIDFETAANVTALGPEATGSGNGITGDDEGSEDVSATFTITARSIGTVAAPLPVELSTFDLE